MKRRDLLKLGGMALAKEGASRLPLWGQTGMPMAHAAHADGKADYQLRIAPVTVELDRSQHSLDDWLQRNGAGTGTTNARRQAGCGRRD